MRSAYLTGCESVVAGALLCALCLHTMLRLSACQLVDQASLDLQMWSSARFGKSGFSQFTFAA